MTVIWAILAGQTTAAAWLILALLGLPVGTVWRGLTYATAVMLLAYAYGAMT